MNNQKEQSPLPETILTLELFNPFNSNLESIIDAICQYATSASNPLYIQTPFQTELADIIIPMINKNPSLITDAYTDLNAQLIDAIMRLYEVSDESKYHLASHTHSTYPLMLQDGHLKLVTDVVLDTWHLVASIDPELERMKQALSSDENILELINPDHIYLSQLTNLLQEHSQRYSTDYPTTISQLIENNLIPYLNQNSKHITSTYPQLDSEFIQEIMNLDNVTDEAKYHLASHTVTPIILQDGHLKELTSEMFYPWLAISIINPSFLFNIQHVANTARTRPTLTHVTSPERLILNNVQIDNIIPLCRYMLANSADMIKQTLSITDILYNRANLPKHIFIKVINIIAVNIDIDLSCRIIHLYPNDTQLLISHLLRYTHVNHYNDNNYLRAILESNKQNLSFSDTIASLSKILMTTKWTKNIGCQNLNSLPMPDQSSIQLDHLIFWITYKHTNTSTTNPVESYHTWANLELDPSITTAQLRDKFLKIRSPQLQKIFLKAMEHHLPSGENPIHPLLSDLAPHDIKELEIKYLGHTSLQALNILDSLSENTLVELALNNNNFNFITPRMALQYFYDKVHAAEEVPILHTDSCLLARKTIDDNLSWKQNTDEIITVSDIGYYFILEYAPLLAPYINMGSNCNSSYVNHNNTFVFNFQAMLHYALKYEIYDQSPASRISDHPNNYRIFSPHHYPSISLKASRDYKCGFDDLEVLHSAPRNGFIQHLFTNHPTLIRKLYTEAPKRFKYRMTSTLFMYNLRSGIDIRWLHTEDRHRLAFEYPNRPLISINEYINHALSSSPTPSELISKLSSETRITHFRKDTNRFPPSVKLDQMSYLFLLELKLLPHDAIEDIAFLPTIMPPLKKNELPMVSTHLYPLSDWVSAVSQHYQLTNRSNQNLNMTLFMNITLYPMLLHLTTQNNNYNHQLIQYIFTYELYAIYKEYNALHKCILRPNFEILNEAEYTHASDDTQEQWKLHALESAKEFYTQFTEFNLKNMPYISTFIQSHILSLTFDKCAEAILKKPIHLTATQYISAIQTYFTMHIMSSGLSDLELYTIVKFDSSHNTDDEMMEPYRAPISPLEIAFFSHLNIKRQRMGKNTITLPKPNQANPETYIKLIGGMFYVLAEIKPNPNHRKYCIYHGEHSFKPSLHQYLSAPDLPITQSPFLAHLCQNYPELIQKTIADATNSELLIFSKLLELPGASDFTCQAKHTLDDIGLIDAIISNPHIKIDQTYIDINQHYDSYKLYTKLLSSEASDKDTLYKRISIYLHIQIYIYYPIYVKTIAFISKPFNKLYDLFIPSLYRVYNTVAQQYHSYYPKPPEEKQQHTSSSDLNDPGSTVHLHIGPSGDVDIKNLAASTGQVHSDAKRSN